MTTASEEQKAGLAAQAGCALHNVPRPALLTRSWAVTATLTSKPNSAREDFRDSASKMQGPAPELLHPCHSPVQVSWAQWSPRGQ